MLEANLKRGAVVLHQFKLDRDVVEPHIDGSTIEGKYGNESVLYESSQSGKQVEAELKYFLDCIEKGERPMIDGVRSLESLRAIWRMYEAEEKGVVADLRG